MRVIDIINEAEYGYTLVFDNTESWIDRIKQFINPNDPQRPFVLRKVDTDPAYELTADKYDANERNEQQIVLDEYEKIKAAYEAADQLAMSQATKDLNVKLKQYSLREITRIRREMNVPKIKKKDRVSLADQIANVIDFINSTDDRQLDNRFNYRRSFMTDADKETLKNWINNSYQSDTKKLQALVNWLTSKESRTATPKELEHTHGELPEDFDPQNPLHVYWQQIVDGARLRGYKEKTGKKEYTMSYKELWQIIQEQEWKCYLTNIPMLGINSHDNSISIDRKDSTVGYIPGNVAFCCYRANIIKGTLAVNELVALCKQILIHKNIISKEL